MFCILSPFLLGVKWIIWCAIKQFLLPKVIFLEHELFFSTINNFIFTFINVPINNQVIIFSRKKDFLHFSVFKFITYPYVLLKNVLLCTIFMKWSGISLPDRVTLINKSQRTNNRPSCTVSHYNKCFWLERTFEE